MNNPEAQRSAVLERPLQYRLFLLSVGSSLAVTPSRRVARAGSLTGESLLIGAPNASAGSKSTGSVFEFDNNNKFLFSSYFPMVMHLNRLYQYLRDAMLHESHMHNGSHLQGWP